MDNKYREYLISKKWASLKRAVHFFYEDECFICRSRKDLHVHHKTYERLFHEDLDDLVLVCSDCHQKIHDDRYTKQEAYKMLLDWTYKSKQDEFIESFTELFPNMKK